MKITTKPVDLRFNSIDFRGSIVDGPGIRSVLFLQGCEQRCPGCHNPSTWDKNQGTVLEVKELGKIISEKCVNKKLTISGGEPLLQYPAVLELVKILKDFDITLYTGYEFDQVPTELLPYLHYIKVGRFILEKKTTITPYIGSTNQKFINLRKH